MNNKNHIKETIQLIIKHHDFMINVLNSNISNL